MKRRDFMKMLAAGSAMSGLGLHSQAAPTAPRSNGNKLLVIFQRGGNDGLNTVIPIEASQYALYQSLRPNIHIPMADILPTSHNHFGLHPQLAPLQPIHAAGHLSFIHCVGYPNPDRSHFESMAFLETAVPGNTLLQGWLNRYFQNTTGPGVIRGVCVGSTSPQSMMGDIPIPTSTNFGTMQVGDDTLQGNDLPPGDLQNILEQIHDLTSTSNNELLYDTGGAIFQMVESFSNRNLDEYVPDNNAEYPDTTLGRNVMHAAQMLKDTPTVLDIEVATIDMNGHDTHAQQVNKHEDLLADLASSMAAFYTDMGSLMSQTLVLVITEFGRRAYENDSAGTDHGTGGVAMVMNHNVNGDVLMGGAWPGLEEENLYLGDDLNWVSDFRDIYWEIMATHLGVSSTALQNIIPEHSYSPLGIF
ncbi:MAG: hypothetical protein CR997_00350 [Acidobacteria bacterium]|nr:MAG: hypothetical protein CR997_00350 [Acidobacteriota bacterium]